MREPRCSSFTVVLFWMKITFVMTRVLDRFLYFSNFEVSKAFYHPRGFCFFVLSGVLGTEFSDIEAEDLGSGMGDIPLWPQMGLDNLPT